jgi:hypothetical protein
MMSPEWDRPMQALPADLERLGLRMAGPERADVLAECLRVARRLAHARGRVLGVLPATDDLGVLSIGAHLAVALAELTGSTVAFVDANVRWPALLDAAAAAAPSTLGQEGSDEAYTTRWIRESVALLAPRRGGHAAAGLPQLAALIRGSTELFDRILVDLTGFKPFGEHLAATEMMDGVVIVGRVGRTREAQLRRFQVELPAEKSLGVLLIGGRGP